jgi:hypothetical protein
VPGDPARPFGEDDVRAKFMRAVAPALTDESAAAMFAAASSALDQPGAALREIDRIPAAQKP